MITELNFILTVALSSAIIVIVLALMGVIIFQRWRLGDKNAALGKFIRENAELRQRIQRAGLLSLAFFLFCCTGDEHDAAKYITINASIGSFTPVNNSFATGDQVSFYAWTGSATDIPADLVVNGAECTLGSNEQWTSATRMTWSGTNVLHYFLAFYPERAVTNFTADPYTLDVNDQHASDLLVARNLTGMMPTENAVPLLFGHTMARLDVNLLFRNQWNATPVVGSVAVKAAGSCTINYLDMTYDIDAPTDIDLPAVQTAEGYEASYQSIMIPQTFQTLTVTIDGQPYTFTHTEDIPLTPGKFTTLNLYVGRDRIDLGAVSINDWIAGPVIDGGSAL